MKTFDLDIKNGVLVNLYAFFRQNILLQLFLLALFDLNESSDDFII